MALNTVADYAAEVRRVLQDTVVGSYRYSDVNLVSALNMGLLEARRLRPDLFAGALRSEVPSFTAVNTDVVTMDPQYRPALVYYMCGQTQLMDEETTQDARATVFLNKFVSQLLTIAA